jgi:hypothetical protein
LAATYATAAEARHAVGMIRAALTAAATQLA